MCTGPRVTYMESHLFVDDYASNDRQGSGTTKEPQPHPYQSGCCLRICIIMTLTLFQILVSAATRYPENEPCRQRIYYAMQVVSPGRDPYQSGIKRRYAGGVHDPVYGVPWRSPVVLSWTSATWNTICYLS